jgi:Xaa-Pro dipeptidase
VTHSMMLFSREEYVQRLERARRLMREQNVDAMLVSAPNNVIYLTGYRTNLFDSNFRPFLGLIPLDGEPVLLLPTLELGVGEEVSWIDDIRVWGPPQGVKVWGPSPTVIAADSLNAARSVIEEKGLAGGRIAIERSFGQRVGMSLDQLAQLESLLPKVEWKDATALMWKLRGVKSPAEVEYLRRANRITDCGYEAVLGMAREGVNERTMQAVMGETFLREGGDLRGFIIVNSGPERYKMMNPFAWNRDLEPGDQCTFDFGAVYNGYWSDLTRSFFVGKLTDRQRQMYEDALEVSMMTVEAVRPGITCGEVDEVAERELLKRGYADHMLHRTGHSIGLEVHEMPSIAKGDATVMEPGMVVAIEPGIYDYDGVGSFRIEDIVLVTETGHEYLSHCRRELTTV